MCRNGGVLGEDYAENMRSGTEAPHLVTYLGKCVSPSLCWVGVRWEVSKGVTATAVVGEVLYYFRCSEGVSFNTWSHTCGSWNFPKFLFKEGSLTPDVHGLLDVPGQTMSLPVHYGKTFRANWMFCCMCVQVYG